MLSVIASIDENNAIGFDNKLLFYISQDMKRFKRLTLGKTVIMGRKTYLSLKIKPLPHRRCIVLSNSDLQIDKVECADINTLKQLILPDEEAFVIGGESVYRQLLPYCSKAYITKVMSAADMPDAFFPVLDNNWKMTFKSRTFIGEDNLEFCYINYKNENVKPFFNIEGNLDIKKFLLF